MIRSWLWWSNRFPFINLNTSNLLTISVEHITNIGMFLLIYLLKSVLSATVTEKFYTVWDNSIIHSNVVHIGTYFEATRSKCAVLCSTYDLCIGADLQKDTLTCTIYKMEYSGTREIFIKPDNSSQVLIIKGKNES